MYVWKFISRYNPGGQMEITKFYMTRQNRNDNLPELEQVVPNVVD